VEKRASRWPQVAIGFAVLIAALRRLRGCSWPAPSVPVAVVQRRRLLLELRRCRCVTEPEPEPEPDEAREEAVEAPDEALPICLALLLLPITSRPPASPLRR